MKYEVAMAWAKDLLDNQDKQGKEALFDGNGYCCLGRLCLLAGKEFEEYKLSEGKFVVIGTDEAMILPDEVQEWSGMRTKAGSIFDTSGKTILELSSLNDAGTSFKALARIIEDNWERL
jgi:hypothetical protein